MLSMILLKDSKDEEKMVADYIRDTIGKITKDNTEVLNLLKEIIQCRENELIPWVVGMALAFLGSVMATPTRKMAILSFGKSSVSPLGISIRKIRGVSNYLFLRLDYGDGCAIQG